jgi:hypothetical protein
VLLVVALDEVDATCLPVSKYDNMTPWTIYVGKTGMKKRVPCSETTHTSHQCCETETRDAFGGCEMADDSREIPECWVKKKIRVCCTEDKK